MELHHLPETDRPTYFLTTPKLFWSKSRGETGWWFRPPWDRKKERPSVLDVERLLRRHAPEIRRLLSQWLGEEEKVA